MTTEEISNLYIRIAFQYESALEQLVDKGLVDKDFADKSKQTFHNALDEEKLRTDQKIRNHMEIIRRYMRGMICEDMVSLTEVARQYSKDSPGYIIQSWMRSRNTLEFLRQWENDMNEEFDDRACEDPTGTYHIAYHYAIVVDSKDSRYWDACKTGQGWRRKCLP